MSAGVTAIPGRLLRPRPIDGRVVAGLASGRAPVPGLAVLREQAHGALVPAVPTGLDGGVFHAPEARLEGKVLILRGRLPMVLSALRLVCADTPEAPVMNWALRTTRGRDEDSTCGDSFDVWLRPT
jgi:hypothetical protein